MAPHHTLMLLSGLLILSFLVDILCRKIRVPAVLFLLATGMLLRGVADALSVPIPDLGELLPILGMLGLVLIVFEAALDLELRRDRAGLIAKSLFCAALILGLSAWAIAALFRVFAGGGWTQALVNAIPLSIISSAVAIPSVGHLVEKRREFVIYESTFSDILGIIVFNFLLTPRHNSWQSVLFSVTGDLAVVLLLSAGSVIALGWMLGKTRGGNNLALVLAILVLLFAGGKSAHLPTLLLVFGLGIILNNAQLFRKTLTRLGVRLRDLLWETRFLKRVTNEATFAVRTYFFVVFGFSILLSDFSNLVAVLLGVSVYLIIIAVRVAVLRLVSWHAWFPEAFIAPRGLITILLFYSIPSGVLLPHMTRDVLLVVVLLSILGMSVALRLQKRDPSEAVAGEAPLPA